MACGLIPQEDLETARKRAEMRGGVWPGRDSTANTASSSRRRCGVFPQFVSQAFDRQDRIVEDGKVLFDPPHMYVHCSCGPVVVVPAHAIQQHVTCEYPSGISQEVFEETELFRG